MSESVQRRLPRKPRRQFRGFTLEPDVDQALAQLAVDTKLSFSSLVSVAVRNLIADHADTLRKVTSATIK